MRNSYVGSPLINLEATRAAAVKRATDTKHPQEETMIHLHQHGDVCDIFPHEFVQPGGQVIKYEAKAKEAS